MESRLRSRCPTIAAHNYRYAKDVCPLEGTQYSAYLRHTTSTPASSRCANTNRNPNLSNLINSSHVRSLYLFSRFHETFNLFCSQMAVTTLLLPAFGGSKKGAQRDSSIPVCGSDACAVHEVGRMMSQQLRHLSFSVK